MNSYQRLKRENEMLKLQLKEKTKFEVMFKNYIRSNKSNNFKDIDNLEKWFIHNSPKYAYEIGLIDFFDYLTILLVK